MTSNNLYHEGELTVQRHAKEVQMAHMNGRAIGDRIPDSAAPFIAQQPMVVIGSVGRDDRVWASLLFGMPGFLKAQDNRTLVLDLSQLRSAADDPLWENVRDNSQVGLLVIELISRRRLRVNGRVRPTSDSHYVIDVDTAYPNCPKYIQRRHWKKPTVATPISVEPSRRGTGLDSSQIAWIKGADTFFVASAHSSRGVDASHRGGRPGFVKVLDSCTLRIPDYAGNSMFNTLGNFVSYPHAGLAFVDFDRGRVLQLSGHPEILWELDDPQQETGGTHRYWQLEVQAWRESELPLHLEWEFLDYSPFIPVPENTQPNDGDALQLQVEKIQQETTHIKRFRLRPIDGSELPAFEPGAHLPISIRLSNSEWAQRHYSILSDSTDRTRYEIAILAEPHGSGGSLYLHGSIKAGDKLEALLPKNDFPMTASADHSILIAGGIGITPILCMLRALQADGRSYELHYSAQRWSDLAFRSTIENMAGVQAHFYASREPGGGRIDLEGLLKTPIPSVHVYVCGPRRMITAVRGLALANQWPTEQIHFESFGQGPTPEDRELTVTLARSGKSVYVPASLSILDALLDAGFAVPHDCKRGECSMCVTRVLDGEPEHRDLCLTSEERANSMCLCVSRVKGNALVLDL